MYNLSGFELFEDIRVQLLGSWLAFSPQAFPPISAVANVLLTHTSWQPANGVNPEY